jgi:hypothetical protein
MNQKVICHRQTQMAWQGFKYGTAIGLGYSLLRYGVNGIVDVITDSVGGHCCPPVQTTMRVITAKRKFQEIESESESESSESDDDEVKEPPRKKAKINLSDKEAAIVRHVLEPKRKKTKSLDEEHADNVRDTGNELGSDS